MHCWQNIVRLGKKITFWGVKLTVLETKNDEKKLWQPEKQTFCEVVFWFV
jgi:hypothetical protein